MADIYNYTFSGQLFERNTGTPSPITGDFTVNYNLGYIIDSKVSFNGIDFTSGRLDRFRNSDGSTSYGASFSYSPFSNEINYLNFYFNEMQETAITTINYSKTFTDYSSGTPVTTFTDYLSASIPVTTTVVCFCTGTGIRVIRHGTPVDVAVEDLQVGDRAVTASGALRPVTWIGHRHLDGRGRALPFAQQPVRVRAGAFGQGLPARDLRLSPGHPVLVGADADGANGHLVPIMCLINGTSIAREAATSVTYWHVELDGHDILLAEGLAAESYLDWGDRPFFTEASDHALHNPDFVVPGLDARCRPVAVDGPVVEAERARLSGVFAAALGADCAWDEAERFGWLAA